MKTENNFKKFKRLEKERKALDKEVFIYYNKILTEYFGEDIKIKGTNYFFSFKCKIPFFSHKNHLYNLFAEPYSLGYSRINFYNHGKYIENFSEEDFQLRIENITIDPFEQENTRNVQIQTLKEFETFWNSEENKNYLNEQRLKLISNYYESVECYMDYFCYSKWGVFCDEVLDHFKKYRVINDEIPVFSYYYNSLSYNYLNREKVIREKIPQLKNASNIQLSYYKNFYTLKVNEQDIIIKTYLIVNESILPIDEYDIPLIDLFNYKSENNILEIKLWDITFYDDVFDKKNKTEYSYRSESYKKASIIEDFILTNLSQLGYYRNYLKSNKEDGVKIKKTLEHIHKYIEKHKYSAIHRVNEYLTEIIHINDFSNIDLSDYELSVFLGQRCTINTYLNFIEQRLGQYVGGVYKEKLEHVYVPKLGIGQYVKDYYNL